MWIQLNLQIKNHIWQKHWDKYLIDYQSENLVLHIHTWWWLQIWDRPTCISYLRMHALYTEDLYVHLSNSIASYIILGSYSSGLFLAKFSDTRPRTCWYILPGTDRLVSRVKCGNHSKLKRCRVTDFGTATDLIGRSWQKLQLSALVTIALILSAQSPPFWSLST